jgi:hypothetical protein
VNPKITQRMRGGAALAVVLALLAPASALALSTGDQGPASAAPRSTAVVGDAVAAQPSGQGHGLGWREAAIGVAIVLGIVLFGLRGDVAVGTVIAAAAALLGAGATLVGRIPRRSRPGLTHAGGPSSARRALRAAWSARRRSAVTSTASDPTARARSQAS